MGSHSNGRPSFLPQGPVTGVDQVQVAQGMKIAELRGTLIQLHQAYEHGQAIIEIQKRQLMRMRVAVLELMKDREPSDPEQPVHVVPRERIAEYQLQEVGCQAVPSEDGTAVEVFVWTGREGNRAAAEREMRRNGVRPAEELEVMKRIVTPG
jgi:hypothetical protein